MKWRKMKLKIHPIIIIIKIEEGHSFERATGQWVLLMREIPKDVFDLIEQRAIMIESDLIMRMGRYKIEEMIL